MGDGKKYFRKTESSANGSAEAPVPDSGSDELGKAPALEGSANGFREAPAPGGGADRPVEAAVPDSKINASGRPPVPGGSTFECEDLAEPDDVEPDDAEPDDAEPLCREWQVPEDYAGRRLDRFLSGFCESCTRSYLQKLIKDGRVTVDGKKAKPGLKLEAEDRVCAVFPPVRELTAEPENIPLDILYEDDDLLVVNKPKGMVVHPAAGHPDGTLVNALLYHCRGSLSGINGVLRPGIVHRIDRDTTGSLIICKNDRAHQAIAAQLKVHSITRKYRAIVHGRLTADGTVNAPIGRHPQRRREMAVNVPGGKPAVTHYHVLETFEQFTSIECRLETGRTHQIRVHMKSIGHPILGDEVYGPAKCPFAGLQGQTLHAMTIGFIHPTTGEYMEFEAPLPEYFRELLRKLRG